MSEITVLRLPPRPAPECGNCRFWRVDPAKETDELRDGDCRYNSPVVVPGRVAELLSENRSEVMEAAFRATVFPVTYDWGWCGRHEPAPTAGDAE